MPAFAYAGMADRVINEMEEIAFVLSIQILCCLYLRFSNSQIARWYKRRVIYATLYLHKRQWMKWLFAWFLSWFVTFPCIWLICIPFLVFAFLPFGFLWIYYCSFVWNSEKRHKYFTGKKALAWLLSVAIPLMVVCAVVMLSEIATVSQYFYSLMALICIAFIFAIPFVLLLTVEGICRLFSRLQKKDNHAEDADGISQLTTKIMQIIKIVLIGTFILSLLWGICCNLLTINENPYY